ncbi:MAG: penicillin-binding protein 2 [Acidobacteriota bacterium]
MRKHRLCRARLGVVVVALIATHAVFVWRLMDLQILHADERSSLAKRQHQRLVKLDPIRGPIYDRNGHELALSIEASSVYADPSEVALPRATARKLARVLGLNETSLRRRLKKDAYFVWVKRKVTDRQKERVERMKLPGVSFVQENRRSYPNGTLAAHVLGYVGIDNEGLAGIEYSHDAEIRGEPGLVRTFWNAHGEGIHARTERVPTGGASLVLTLDRVIQHLAERELAEAVRKHRALSGSAVVLEPATGAVLALANVPTYNPNHPRRSPISAWRNRAVMDAYEPGSTFKMFVAAAALEEGLTRPSERIYCEKGAVRVGRRFIRDHKPFGDLSYAEVLQESSNVGSIKVGLRLSASRFFESMASFGFGVRSGIELAGENSGILRSPSAWSEQSQAMLSIGQEVSVTPLQLAAAAAALANGGVYHKPYLVERVIGRDGRVLRVARRDPGRRLISTETSQTLRHMLEGVVLRGTGRRARVAGYSAAGKTGTAQKIDHTGRYSRRNFVASFVGWAPAQAPALVILVVIDSPQGNYHGGSVAAPVFSRIALPALQYLRVPPETPASSAGEPVPLVADAAAGHRLHPSEHSR